MGQLNPSIVTAVISEVTLAAGLGVLTFPHPYWVQVQTRRSRLEVTGEIRLRELVKEALRMRPSWMVLGELRSKECLDLLLALNAGLPSLCTLHTNGTRERLVKSCTLPMLAGETYPVMFSRV